MARRYQKEISLTEYQESYVRENYGKISVRQICIDIGITENVFHQNRRLMNLEKKRSYPTTAERNNVQVQHFDVDQYLKTLSTI